MESNQIVARVHGVMAILTALGFVATVVMAFALMSRGGPALVMMTGYAVLCAVMSGVHFWCRKGALELDNTARIATLVVGVLMLPTLSLATLIGAFLIYHSYRRWESQAESRGRMSSADLSALFPTAPAETVSPPSAGGGDRDRQA